jgi:hypothetical protein
MMNQSRDMIPTISYQQILTKLTMDFDYWRREDRELKVTMCGFLFARPQNELASKEIFPEIEYFNHRMGPRIHIFTAGCFDKHFPREQFRDRRPVGGEKRWAYSDEAFDSLRREIEEVTAWRYQDGVELLLLNATRNAKTGKASLDFHSAICVDLQKARELKSLDSVAALIGRLANYCEHYQGDDPTWGFSDQIGIDTARSALWNLFIGLLPEGLRKDAGTARLFVAQDLSKPNASPRP